MKKLNKLIILLLLLIPNLVLAQERVVPIAEYTASNTDWQSNLYDIYYVACRCGFAYHAAYEEMQKHNEDEIDTSLHDRGYAMVMNMTDYIYEYSRVIGHHERALMIEIDAIFSFYQHDAAKNYIKNNQFKGIIGKDISACKDYESFYDGLVQRAV